MAGYNNLLMTFKLKIEEAVALVPDMSAEQKLKAVQHWNVVSEKLQDIVNSSAADIGALALLECKEEEKVTAEEIGVNSHSESSSNSGVAELNQDQRLPLEPISINPLDDVSINDIGAPSNSHENLIEDKSASMEIENHADAGRRGNVKKSNAEKQMPLSKKLAVLKEKESERFSLDITGDELASVISDKIEEFAPEKSYAERSEVTSKNAETKSSFQQDTSAAQMNLLNGSAQETKTTAGKENSSRVETSVDIDQVVPTEKGVFPCPVCKHYSLTKAHLKAHFSSHRKPFSCEHCNVKFSSKANLTVHKRRHTGERPFVCDICYSTFTTGGNLKRHKVIHTGAKPFQCELCSKCFTEKKTLKIHMRKHTGERPFKCNVCGQTFTQLGALHSHMAKHMNIRDYLCDLCGRAFRQRSQLRLHQLRHDGAKKFNCSDCDMKFITRGDLDRHMRRHTGEKPFLCDLCDKTFTRQQSLNEHKNRHLGRKPYTCKYCDKTFHEKSGCYKHIKAHSPQNAKPNPLVSSEQKNEPFLSSTLIENHDSNFDSVEQVYNSTDATNIQEACQDQLIQVDGYSNSKYLLLQTQLGSDTQATTDHLAIADSIVPSTSACENISVVEFSMIPTSRFPSSDTYG